MTTGTQKLNGTAKLEALEKNVAALANALQDTVNRIDQQFKIVAEELNRVNEINVALAKRLNAIIKAGDEGGVTSDGVKDQIVNEAAKELEGKVRMLVDQGVLVRDDSKLIDDDTFVVGREIDSEGKQINPRTQFLVRALQEEAKAAVLGKKAGDEIKDEKLGQVLILTEVYNVVQPKVEEESEVADAVSEQPAEAVGAEVMRTKTKRSIRKV